ncbi:MAG: XrtA/PEP-CTERM system TPR-repeat protein PrsT [Stellaceae bacterium]
MRNNLVKAGAVLAVFMSLAAVAHAADYLGSARKFLAKGDLKAAEIELKNAVRANPHAMEAHYLLARVELQLGNPVAAEFQAKAARAGGYDLAQTVPLLAETYLQQHKLREILQDFPATTGSAAQRAGVLVIRGYAQIALGQRDEALKSFQQAETLAPLSPQPLLAEGKLLLSERKYTEAKTRLDRALGLAPKSTEIRLTKAQLLRVSGHAKEALALLDQTVHDAPQYLPARLERADLLVAENKDALASADITTILKAQPGNPGALYLQAILFAKSRNYKAADTNLARLSNVLARFPRGYYLAALVKFNLHEYSQAEDAVRRYVARQPDDLAGKKLLGLIDLAQSRPDETIALLASLEKSGKADAGTLDLLGRAYMATGQSAKALAAFQQAVKLAPKNAALRLYLGETRLQTGNSADAVAALEQSLQLAPSVRAGEILAITEMGAGHWKEALAAADKLRSAQPKNPAGENLTGLIKLAQFDLDGARAVFEKLAQTDPNFLPAQLNLARIAELQEKPAAAEQILAKILGKEPANGAVLTRYVNLLLSQRQPERALAAAEHAHQTAPTNTGITVGLIDLYIRLGHKNKALTLAQQEPGTNTPENAPLIAARARAELAAGHKSDAAQNLRRLIGIYPKGLAQRRELASVLLSAGDTAGARQAIGDARKIAPDNPQLIADQIAIDLKSSGLTAALATAERLQKSNPNLPTAPALPGDVYMAAKQYAKAIAAYQTAFQKAPSALLAVRLAQARAAAGQTDAAAEGLRDWLKTHPDDVAIDGLLASSDIAAHRFPQATRELEAQVAKSPRNAIALNNLAWLYQRAGDPRARALAERAYLLQPNLSQTEDTLGWILVRQGQAAKGLALLRSASASQPANPAVQYHLAVALNDTDHPAEARKLLASLIGRKIKFDDEPAAQKLLASLSKPSPGAKTQNP